MASLKYRYTSGPVSISEGINNIRVLVLNNGSYRHNARIKIYNLDPKPKDEVFNELFTVAPQSKINTEFIPMFNSFEVQILTDSSRVYTLEGNIILHKDMIKF
jgi:hypothetical protein